MHARYAGRGERQDELDLHGLAVAAAKPLLVSFLNACARSGCARVRIIHGKGLRSPGGEGILKRMVADGLRSARRARVLRGAAGEGGAGATVVLLRRG